MTTEPRPDSALLLTTERCARLREAFDEACDLPAHELAQWLTDHVSDPDDRAALALLLDGTDRDGPLELASTERMRRMEAGPADSMQQWVGRQFGAFRLLRLLGHGGMATVFLGERIGADFRQHAAVKLLRRGLFTPWEERLFQREQRALASLSHPNIAHFIDGGVSTEGIPFLILEFVNGEPLTRYVSERRLTVIEQLRLFVVVCRAVAAAHRQLIVHRDIKPSNILVTAEGDVKLLDFGIAKLLGDEGDITRTAVPALTLGYAAPEQFAGGTITMATDVYALGVVLHEMLLGERPPSVDADGEWPSRRLSARVSSPLTNPTATVAAIRGDIDNILLKSLASEPDRRYASAADLADDIERHLATQPVSAHPPSRWYRTRKFVRRNRGSMVLTAAFALGIFLSLGVALWQAAVARAEAANARAEALRADTTRDFIERLFEPVRDQIDKQGLPSIRDLVATGTRQLDENTAMAPAQRIDLLLMFSRLQHMLAESTQSLALAERAQLLASQSLPTDSSLRNEATFAIGRARLRAGELAKAEPLLREVEQWQQNHPTQPEDAIALSSVLARFENESHRYPEALAYARKELALRIGHYGADSAQVATGYNNLGYALEPLGEFDEAILAYERALAIDDLHREPSSQQRSVPLGNLAQALFNAGHLQRARARFQEALSLQNDHGIDKPPRHLLGQYTILNETLLALGDLPAAHASIATYQQLAEHTAPTLADRAIAQRQHARLELEQGNLPALKSRMDRLDDVLTALPENSRRRSAAARDILLAEVAILEQKTAEAKLLAVRGNVGFGERIYPHTIIPNAKALLALACALAASADCDADAYEKAATSLSAPFLRGHPAVLPAQIALARTELVQGKPGKADARLRAALAAAKERGVDAGSPRLAQAQAWLAVVLAQQGDCAGSASALAETRSHADHPFVTSAMTMYASLPACVTP